MSLFPRNRPAAVSRSWLLNSAVHLEHREDSRAGAGSRFGDRTSPPRTRGRSRWVVPILAAIRSLESRFRETGGDVGRVSSDGKVEERIESPPDKEERKKERKKEDGKKGKRGEGTSLRSRVRRRASRCQIYRRVLDGACPRLLISPVASMLDAYRARASIESISHEFPFLRRERARRSKNARLSKSADRGSINEHKY